MISATLSDIMTTERKQECPLPFPEKKRKVLDIAFAEGDRLGVPVILETDARSKCDKYIHLGMELAGVRDIGEFGKLYDLIRYPKSSNENGTA